MILQSSCCRKSTQPLLALSLYFSVQYVMIQASGCKQDWHPYTLLTVTSQCLWIHPAATFNASKIGPRHCKLKPSFYQLLVQNFVSRARSMHFLHLNQISVLNFFQNQNYICSVEKLYHSNIVKYLSCIKVFNVPVTQSRPRLAIIHY